MTVNHRNEVELKFKAGMMLADFSVYKKTLARLGFVSTGRRIETDYLPDTADGLCKKNGILLRFRHVQTLTVSEWVLTLKVRKPTKDVIDFFEIETSFNDGENDTFRHINDLLERTVGRTLSPRVLRIDTLDGLRDVLVSDGLEAHRILLDKYRQCYEKDRDHVLLDFFPDGMGAYVEIESYDQRSLETLASAIVVEGEKITDDYGDILKNHKKTLPYHEQRTALFSSHEKDALLGSDDE